jgi:serine/threonine protein kinase/tetratricopeptide (TPR) repeat protein
MAQAQLQQEQPLPRHSDLTGESVGRFLICERVGVGGMGEVYRAEDTQLKRTVALKRIAPMLHSDERFREHFIREAVCASRLNDPHIAGIYDVVEENSETFLVMEYVDGQTLRRRLSQPLGLEEFLAIAFQCAMALTASEEQRIIHGDIKPENIMLTRSGQVKILDFGLAKTLPPQDENTVDQLSAQSGLRGGTPAYMAPEVLQDEERDGRADIFSLGVVFYESLTGHHPFQSDKFLTTCKRIIEEVPPPLIQYNPKIPAVLERVVGKMLSKRPDDRYATAADLLVDIRAVQRSLMHPATLMLEPDVLKRKTFWLTKRKAVLAAVAIVILAGIAFLPQLNRRFHWSSAAPVRPKNLAVLPFESLDGGPESKASADGMTDMLTAKLTSLTATHALQVVSAVDVRSRNVNNADTARNEFGSSLVLQGSVRHSGDVVHVKLALVDTMSHRQLRADTITSPASEPLLLEDRVAAGIVDMLDLELNPQEREALQKHGTEVTGAFDLYLLGQGYLQNYDLPENIDNAIHSFARALALDRNYALAQAGLGKAYWKKFEVEKDAAWVQLAREACEQAVALDPRVAAGHICLGTLHTGTGMYDTSAKEFQVALDADPTSDEAYRGLALAFERQNKSADAENTYRRAIKLRPNYWAGYSWLGGFYYRQARYVEAEEMFNRVVALIPYSFLGYSSLGAIETQKGRYAEAIVQLQRSISIRPTYVAYSNLATAYFHEQHFEDAARTYEEALKLKGQDYRVWGNLGDAYFWAPGKRAEAARAYQKAIALVNDRLQVNPRDVYLLSNLAGYRAMLGERKSSLEPLRKALELAPGDPEVRFRAALVHNQFGEIPATLDWLEKAVAAGYSTTKVRDSPDFNALRSNPRFQQLFRKRTSQ